MPNPRLTGVERGNQCTSARARGGASGAMPEEDLQPPARQLTSQALLEVCMASVDGVRRPFSRDPAPAAPLNHAHAPHASSLPLLTLGALGVVYGDIGTSPLYALRECFH